MKKICVLLLLSFVVLSVFSQEESKLREVSIRLSSKGKNVNFGRVLPSAVELVENKQKFQLTLTSLSSIGVSSIEEVLLRQDSISLLSSIFTLDSDLSSDQIVDDEYRIVGAFTIFDTIEVSAELEIKTANGQNYQVILNSKGDQTKYWTVLNNDFRDTVVCAGDEVALEYVLNNENSGSHLTGPGISVADTSDTWVLKDTGKYFLKIFSKPKSSLQSAGIIYEFNYTYKLSSSEDKLYDFLSICDHPIVDYNFLDRDSLRWESGDTSISKLIDKVGEYSVDWWKDGCSFKDEFKVDSVYFVKINLQNGFENILLNQFEIQAIDSRRGENVKVEYVSSGSMVVIESRQDSVIIEAIPDSTLTQFFPTYSGETVQLNKAQILDLKGCDTVEIDFSLIEIPEIDSTVLAFIQGFLFGNSDKKNGCSGNSNGFKGVKMLLLDAQKNPVAFTYTNEEGYFEFNHLPSADMIVVPDLQRDVEITIVASKEDVLYDLLLDEDGLSVCNTRLSVQNKKEIYHLLEKIGRNRYFSKDQGEKFLLYDNVGKKVGSFREIMDFNHLSSGIYFLMATSEKNIQKAIKIRVE